jgi:outer membrane protein assembly factor BamB
MNSIAFLVTIRRSLVPLALIVPAILTVGTSVSAADFPAASQHQWHQWRGPLATGVAPHGDPPVEWSETKNVHWKVPIPGEGSATPIVWGDQVFVVTAVRTDRTLDTLSKPDQEPPGGYKTERPKNFYRFEVLAVDRRTGRTLWRRTATEAVPHEGRHDTNTYASGSPSTDGQRLYVFFGSQGTYCYDLQGNLLWKRDLGRMVTRFGWGEGASSTLYGDSLVVNWDHEGRSFLTVLDAQTGQTRWKVDRDEVSSWATPLVTPYQGGVQIVVNASNRVRGYDLATGKLLWQCGGQSLNVIPTPVRFGDTVIAMSGFGSTAAYAIPLDSTGDITGSDHVAWHYKINTPYVPSPLLVGDRLYFTKWFSPILTCLDARTGKVLMEAQRLPGLKNLYASPVAAAGRIYFVGREGGGLVIREQPQFEILATNRLDDHFDASPAIVGRQMFLRGKSHLYCISEP